MKRDNQEERNVNKGSTDEDLMLAYAHGDYTAFETLYQRHAKTVFGFLVKKVKNHEMAEDILQETFLRLHRSRAKYDSSLPFLPWLFTICRNSLIDRVRAQSRNKEDLMEMTDALQVETLQVAPPALSYAATPQLTELSTLSNKEQEVLTLRYGEDLSFNKIAEVLGMKAPAVRKLSQRAIEKLRSLWK